ncbi:ribonuclease P 40kDa subunit-domain-containing protein [Phlebopus sp. FC_14]|nr:ribonuclease P 40kDa subunit-domain-containing protein [Phlebopus sp. FC_14]
MQISRVMVSNGELPSARLDQMAASHPFIQQIDVVFPSSPRLNQAFSSLETTYSKGRCTLLELYEYASQNASLKALPIESNDEDTWCIDPRGIMTLCVSKTLYEKLGLIGHKLPFKGCPEQYIIRIVLRKETESVGVRARHRAALELWDSMRETTGVGKWEVVFVDAGSSEPGPSGPPQIADIKPRIWKDEDMSLPVPGLVQSEEESSEDWKERLGELFEWAGMACLGAQRLKANDRVDPYVAVYETPSPSRISNVTHIRWNGLMETTFAQSLINTATSLVSTSPGGDGTFISILIHSSPMAPVSYIPPSEAQSRQSPLRVPRPDAEDTCCLILSASSDKSSWVMGQSVGKWDARWG